MPVEGASDSPAPPSRPWLYDQCVAHRLDLTHGQPRRRCADLGRSGSPSRSNRRRSGSRSGLVGSSVTGCGWLPGAVNTRQDSSTSRCSSVSSNRRSGRKRRRSQRCTRPSAVYIWSYRRRFAVISSRYSCNARCLHALLAPSAMLLLDKPRAAYSSSTRASSRVSWASRSRNQRRLSSSRSASRSSCKRISCTTAKRKAQTPKMIAVTTPPTASTARSLRKLTGPVSGGVRTQQLVLTSIGMVEPSADVTGSYGCRPTSSEDGQEQRGGRRRAVEDSCRFSTVAAATHQGGVPAPARLLPSPESDSQRRSLRRPETASAGHAVVVRLDVDLPQQPTSTTPSWRSHRSS